MTEDNKNLTENELDEKQLDEVSGGLADPDWNKTPAEKLAEMQEWIDANK